MRIDIKKLSDEARRQLFIKEVKKLGLITGIKRGDIDEMDGYTIAKEIGKEFFGLRKKLMMIANYTDDGFFWFHRKIDDETFKKLKEISKKYLGKFDFQIEYVPNTKDVIY